METLIAAAHECAAAKHGELGGIIDRAARVLDLSPQRTHTLVTKTARSLGLATPRKKRVDAGESSVTDADLDAIAGVRWKDLRNGKRMITLEETINMLHQEGKISARLSASHVGKLLRQRGLDVDSLAAPAPHVRMRTEHVNAVVQVDASVCVLYRAPSGELRLIEEGGVHYKNKPQNLVPVLDKLLTRFVAVEHASGCIAARFYVGGETTENLLDFLMWLVTQRHGPQGEPMPFHGVFYTLYSDQGGMFKSGPVRSFCSAMGIRQQWHAPGNSRATGSVEVAQNIFERGFESRLRFVDRASMSVPVLNALAEQWMHAFNGTKKHSRHNMTRYAAWSTIGAEHLRLAPSMEVMRSLPASLAQPRQVSGNSTVSFALKGQGSRDYDVRYVPGVSPRDKVLVCVNPLAAPAVRVGVTDRDTGEIVWHDVQPVPKGFMGYQASAPVLGQDDYQAMPATPADERRARIRAKAYAKDGKPATATEAQAAEKAGATPYQGQWNPFADIQARAAGLPQFLQQRGTPHVPHSTEVQRARLPVAAACQRLRAALGDAYDAGTYAWLTQQHGDAGVPEDVVDGLIAAHEQRVAAASEVTPAAPGLRAVGGI
ncbi:integrase catalytic domain-containing protein [Paracidovorax anthurii]|uniref:Integrase-like protein n=1 Tax=Paracidovorax anthurii TaxID=78229 RepID=A0A328ZIM3_9BURK|nr:DDE-type integrase/transposase/recombinase [Paracidovorax anthurii]RAR86078.1 integrase-like protein [Paracidovorax anthurii]